MSAFIDSPFAELAPPLYAAGHQPVPIKLGYKAPMLPEWQTPRPPSFYLPRYQGWGTGILTATTPAIDLDIRHKAVVRACIDLADEIIGLSPVRIGQPPKALLPFSASAPFGKVEGRWFALPGEDWRAVGFRAHRCEVLAAGQQYVAYATHPDTRRPYRWARGELMGTPRDALPVLTEALARVYVDTVAQLLIGIGATPLKLSKGEFAEDVPEPERTPRRPGAAGEHPAQGLLDQLNGTTGSYYYQAWDDSWRDLDPETVARQLDPEGAKATTNGWSCACPVHHGVGHTSLGLAVGRDGRLIVNCFAGCSFFDIADTISDLIGRAAA